MYIVIYVIFIGLSNCVFADEHSHKYEDGEEAVLWMNTIGPYHNRQETYPYFSMPFCRGPKRDINHYHETLGEALLGVELEFSGLDIDFKTPVKKQPFCELEITRERYDILVYAIRNYYWYQMYLDDLPIWGIVGEQLGVSDNKNAAAHQQQQHQQQQEKQQQKYFLYTHKKFDIGYNAKQIVEVSLTNDEKVELRVGAKISFSYEVVWHASAIPFSKRFDKYLDENFFQHRIHWFSIFNSFMMVIFLVGLVVMILMRTLKRDYARYGRHDDLDGSSSSFSSSGALEKDLGDEYGWKQVHGDVFRPVQHNTAFSSLVGIGTHILVVAFFVILIALSTKLYTERGSILSSIILIYTLTAPLNGFVGGGLYTRMAGKRWIRQLLVGALLMPLVVSLCVLLVNLIAVYYQASRAIPLGTMIAMLSLVGFVVLPLHLVGTVIGRNLIGQPNYPCRINAVPRPIPEKKWFMQPLCIVALAGLLPFGSIFIEMYFVFTSFWAYKIYYVFGFTLLVLIILVVVVSCVTIVCIYFLLNAEDYRWQWTSFYSGASIALYVYLYSFYYYFFKTKMYGLFQTSFFFVYMAMFCVLIGCMCGTIGYFAASKFVKKIYSYVKID